MQRALWFLVSMATLAVPMAAAHREGLKTGLQEALSLAESGRFDQANTVLRRVSGCDIALDAVPVDSIWKDAPARGIRKVLARISHQQWATAGPQYNSPEAGPERDACQRSWRSSSCESSPVAAWSCCQNRLRGCPASPGRRIGTLRAHPSPAAGYSPIRCSDG